MRKPKVAIVRGPGLSKWEMQIYEPLDKWFNLTGFGATDHANDARDITFPLKHLPLKFKFFQKFPQFTQLMNTYFGDTQWLGDFDGCVRGYDLLHTVELRNGYTLQAVRAKRRGLVKRVTATIYENIPFVGDEYPRRAKIKHEVIAYIDHFLAANEAARQCLLVEGVKEEKITIVPQSVDINGFAPDSSKRFVGLRPKKLREKYGFSANDFVVLATGRMVWEKGWYDIVRSAYVISNIKYRISKRKKIRFLLVGDGPELKNLKRMVNALGLDNVVTFTGNIAYRVMPDTFRAADIFVLASLPTRVWNEQFGGVLIEAMATGLPIVGTLNGGIEETVGETGGLFVPPQDFFQLNQAIIKLYNNPMLRLRMGESNRAKVKKQYDNHIVAENIKNIWLSVLAVLE